MTDSFIHDPDLKSCRTQSSFSVNWVEIRFKTVLWNRFSTLQLKSVIESLVDQTSETCTNTVVFWNKFVLRLYIYFISSRWDDFRLLSGLGRKAQIRNGVNSQGRLRWDILHLNFGDPSGYRVGQVLRDLRPTDEVVPSGKMTTLSIILPVGEEPGSKGKVSLLSVKRGQDTVNSFLFVVVRYRGQNLLCLDQILVEIQWIEEIGNLWRKHLIPISI